MRGKNRKRELALAQMGGGRAGQPDRAFQAWVFLVAGLMALGLFLRMQTFQESLGAAEHILAIQQSAASNNNNNGERILTNNKNDTSVSSSSTTTAKAPPTTTASTTTTTTASTAAAAASASSAFSSLDVHQRIQHFRDTALGFNPVTDKIGIHSEHRYHNMYGQYLLPYATVKPNFKLLEIGLGCNMNYGPGASVALWKQLFPEAELWEAEYDGDCVAKALAKGQLEGIHPLVGDQADFATLDQWISKSGGQFDIVIDDGGHHNCQMSNSFDKLWPQVLPGGIYFIEDLHVGKANSYKSPQCNNLLMTDRILQWTEQLMYKTNTFGWVWEHKLPNDVLFVSCQVEACVIGKKKSDEINGPYKPMERTT